MNPIPLPYRLLGALIAALVLAGGGFVAGVKITGNAYKAKQLEAERQAHAQYEATVESWSKALQQIMGDREEDNRKADADRRNFQRRLDDAKRNPQTLATCQSEVAGSAPGTVAAGDPAGVRLTAVFVGLYNDALRIGIPEGIGTRQPDGSGRGSDPAGTVTPGEVLDNAAQNSTLCNKQRADLIEWQRWACSIDAAPKDRCPSDRVAGALRIGPVIGNPE
jgi:hypothetical protein